MLHVYATLQYMYSIYIPLHLYDYEAEGKLSIYMLGQWIILFFLLFYQIYLLLNITIFKKLIFSYKILGKRVEIWYW